MMDREGRDYIWVGNIGRYVEGELAGDWLELPYREDGLREFLEDRCGVDPLHEEVAIFDVDLMGPLGALGIDIGEYDDIGDVNLLAMTAAGLDDDRICAVRALMDQGRHSALEYANAVVQADEIGFRRMAEGSFLNDGERLAYSVLEDWGGPATLGDDELRRHFDYAAYAREMLIDGVVTMYLDVSDDGERSYNQRDFIVNPCCLVLESRELYDIMDRFSEASLARMAENSLDESISYLTEKWRIHSKAVEHLASENPAALCACAEILRGLPDETQRAVWLYGYSSLSASAGPEEYANVALQADWLAHGSIGTRGDMVELGAAVADWLEPDREDLVRFFDYESYGQELSQDFIIHAAGYLPADADGPDLARYGRGELRAMLAEKGPQVATSASIRDALKGRAMARPGREARPHRL